MRMNGLIACALAMLLVAPPAAAQALTAPTSAPAPATLNERAAQLPALIRGDINFAAFFTPEFLAAVPPEQLKAINSSLIAQHGDPQAVDRIDARDAVRATVYLRFAKSVGKVEMTIDLAQGGRVAGLLLTGFTRIDDSIAKVAEEIRALPGQTSLLVVPLGNGAAAPIVAHQVDRPMAIGSTFKLYILAELAAQVRQRKLGWDRVTTVDRRSFSSTATQYWPADAPVTLHTLASWMISVSDNAATDVLIDVLGRDAVGKRMALIGNSVADRNLPFLNTVEAFALKADGNADLRARFLSATEAEQQRLLSSEASKLTLDAISGEMFIGKPMHIDTIEWFASAADLVRLLDHFRGELMTTERAIMAINPGIARDVAARWRYLGYKGGSEAGVISMSFLLQAKDGRWFAVTGSWNNVATPVDNEKFASLMRRLVEQLAKDLAS